MRLLPLFFVALVIGCEGSAADGDDTGNTHDTDIPVDRDGDGYTSASGDCDDADSSVYPGADEVWYDGIDQDCSGGSDYDQDQDGADQDVDCDDDNPEVQPGAVDKCDSVDNDCDGELDEDGLRMAYADEDLDGFGSGEPLGLMCELPTGTSDNADDCDDTVAAVSPAADEVCDRRDNDCDWVVDEPSAVDARLWHADFDGDTYGDPVSTATSCAPPVGFVASDTDCDDDNPAINPDAFETCDGVDQNCDGEIDEEGATGGSTWYIDFDADGYGLSSSTIEACSAPAGYAGLIEDCDDEDSTRSPGTEELDDGVDNDCDGMSDEDFISEGDVIITEITRQPRVGSASTNTDAQWFELYNTSESDIDLSGWYIRRGLTGGLADAYYVDPADAVIIASGDFAVFCKTDNYVSTSDGFSMMNPCDYYWGAEAESPSYSSTYADNTFNLQRDADMLEIYVGGDSTTGLLVDSVAWSYDSTGGYWPRDGSRSMQLDPSAYDSVSNDSIDSWCSTTNNAFFDWYYASSSAREFGTPGVEGHVCP